MEITVQDIKKLRDRTNVGLMDCKKALKEADGDMDKAVDILRTKGIAKAEKKAEREASEGIIYSYIHPGAKLGVLLELSCETDFVARNDKFEELAKKIAMHIAATDPLALSEDDLDEEIIKKEKRIYQEQAEAAGKPEKIIDKIVDGRLNKFYEDNCLLKQPLVMNEDIKVEQLINDAVMSFGENIYINRYTRYKIGEQSAE